MGNQLNLEINNDEQLPSLQNQLDLHVVERLNIIPSIITQLINDKKPIQSKFQIPNSQTKYKIINEQYFYQGTLNQYQQPHGEGVIIKPDATIFVGHFTDGTANGKGLLIFNYDNYYEGTFKDNDLVGFVQIVEGNYKFEGTVNNFKYNGSIKQAYKGQIINQSYQFQGQVKQGKLLNGKLVWFDQNNKKYQYTGSFNQQQQFQGKGTLKNHLGTYVGQFKNGLKHGKGQFTNKQQIIYQGQYKQGLKSGKGILYQVPLPENADKDRKIIENILFKGQFLNGVPVGTGFHYDQTLKKLVQVKLQGAQQNKS